MERFATDQIVCFLAEESKERTVILEGPPIYLWPVLPVQQWDHPAFMKGWRLVELIRSNAEQIPGSSVRHWVLIDDLNFRPSGIGQVDVAAGVAEITKTVPELAQLPVFASITDEFRQGRGFRESDFVVCSSSLSCCQLDSGFQIRKLTAGLLEGKGDLKEGWIPLAVMVHPREFWHQQEAMLGCLLGRMKERPYLDRLYAKIPTFQRKRIIEDTFLHIWMNSEGGIDEITVPRWDESQNKFNHQPKLL